MRNGKWGMVIGEWGTMNWERGIGIVVESEWGIGKGYGKCLMGNEECLMGDGEW